MKILDSITSHSVKRADWLYRRVSASWRALPDFIMIGAPRCGTSSLYAYLTEGTYVVSAMRKELHFFDAHYSKGLMWYRANFPRTSLLESDQITGEATPNYLVHPYIPPRVRLVTPDIKLILLLRNPIDRTQSAWRHNQRRGREQLPFLDALSAEPNRVAEDIARFGRGEAFQPSNYLRYSYLGKSRYAEHVERWFEVFDRTQILICKSEDLFSNQNETMRTIHSFLGIPWVSGVLPRVNASEPCERDPEVHERLADYFHPHNLKLYELVGRDFGWS